MRHPLLVISLKRTPKRLRDFYTLNKKTLIDWDVEVIDGIDGVENQQITQKSRWVSASARKHWTKGAIGSALSHIKAWQRCIELNQEVLIAEDDVILANNLRSELERLQIVDKKGGERSFILLGWNLDSVLYAELAPKLDMISLFEPTYPTLEQLKELINGDRERNLCDLTLCFGLPAYWISPQIARELMAKCKPFKLEVNKMTRGIPEHTLITLDGMLTNRYKDINAKITIPPLALALNDQRTSLTNSEYACNFEG